MVLDRYAESYPGDPKGRRDITRRRAVAKWMAARAYLRGLPPELPVMTALVESEIQNLDWGDRDSLGYFQQRPSILGRNGKPHWGTAEQIMDPVYSTDRFLLEANRKKAQFIGQAEESLGPWCQEVQRSAFPNRYQTRLAQARELLEGLHEMIEIHEGSFTARNVSDEILNIRSGPGATYRDVGNVSVGDTVECDGYTTEGAPYESSRVWLRLTNDRGWITGKSSRTAYELPPTAKELASRLSRALAERDAAERRYSALLDKAREVRALRVQSPVSVATLLEVDG